MVLLSLGDAKNHKGNKKKESKLTPYSLIRIKCGTLTLFNAKTKSFKNRLIKKSKFAL